MGHHTLGERPIDGVGFGCEDLENRLPQGVGDCTGTETGPSVYTHTYVTKSDAIANRNIRRHTYKNY